MADTASPATFYLDSMTFIFAIEGEPNVSRQAQKLLNALRKHPGAGVTSELTLAEVLAGSKHGLSPTTEQAYLDLIVWSRFLNLAPVNRDVLYESAKLRLMHRKTHGKKLALPDAIHLVTAIQQQCRYLVSADEGIKPPVGMTKIAFDSHGIDEALMVLA